MPLDQRLVDADDIDVEDDLCGILTALMLMFPANVAAESPTDSSKRQEPQGTSQYLLTISQSLDSSSLESTIYNNPSL